MLRQAALRGWGLTTTLSCGLAALLLAAAPWPNDPRISAPLVGGAILSCGVALFAVWGGVVQNERSYERRHGR